MSAEAIQKVNSSHLERNAYLYVRQSTPRQVVEHAESAKRQYALKQRAVVLGWAADQVVIIDKDQGQSGASAADREGFQQLVAEVSLGRAGIVLGLEVSRLARNNAEWHRLLEICALANTLILDEDGVYDPGNFNDRLLLGLKGTMSEAELHVLQARMRGGLLNKARRGDLAVRLPTGFIYDEAGHVALDPDLAVQESIRQLFVTFRRVGSALGAVRLFREQGLKFPVRPLYGPNKDSIVWIELERTRAVQILKNPRYAGAYVYGRNRSRKKPDGMGRTAKRLSRDQWDTLLLNAHAGYITWDEFEANQRRLQENAQAHGANRRHSPPREGPALLQGIVFCGVCGSRMIVRYHHRCNKLRADYVCQTECTSRGVKACQFVPGWVVDEQVGQLLVEAVTPLALEVALEVQDEIQCQLKEADRIRQAQVERARYDAEMARRRYMSVDPSNRLVASTLEADWNRQLLTLRDAEEEYERQRQADERRITAEERSRIMGLATNFSRVWCDESLPDRERKRMIRLIVEDVTLLKGESITVGIRFRGGAAQSITVPIPPSGGQIRKTSPEIVGEIDRLLDQHTYQEIADILNSRGILTRVGNSYKAERIRRIQERYKLRSREDRLREMGFVRAEDVARLRGLSYKSINQLRKQGRLECVRLNDRPEFLYRLESCSNS